MPPKPAYHRDISGRIEFPAGYEPSITELEDAAKDGFPHLDTSRVIVIIIGKRDPKAARLRLHTTTNNWAGYGPNDRPTAAAVIEKAKTIFSSCHPSLVRVGVITSKSVSSTLCIGLTIPSIGAP